MSRILRTLACSVVAAVLSAPAGAQGVLAQKTVSLGLAQSIAQAALDKCSSLGYKATAAVVDRGGNLIVLLHGDGAGLHTNEGAERKAFTARTFSQPSADFVKRLNERPETAFGSRQYTRVIALSGGLPIKVGNEVIGAVGVSGSPGKDDECSQAGIDKVAAQLK